MGKDQYGEWAFLAGIVIAVVLGLFAFLSVDVGDNLVWVYGLLAVLGLVVGLLNVKEKETTAFLVSAIALGILPSALVPVTAVLNVLSDPVSRFTGAVGIFVAPAAFVVALKAIYNLARAA